jgi:mycothiol synthase
MAPFAFPTDIAIRPAKDGDQQAIAQLLHRCSESHFGSAELPVSATLEEIRAIWQMDGFDLEADSLVAVTQASQIIGYVTVSLHEGYRMKASPRIHPEYQGRGLGTAILRWAEQRARQIAQAIPPERSVALTSWIEEVDEAAKELLIREGFLLERYWWHMEIRMEKAPVIPTWPEGIHVRTFVSGQDERATYEALAEAFQANEGDPYETFEDWLHRTIDKASFDPSLWFLAMNGGGEIAGVLLSEFQRGKENAIGWISELGVRPHWRKRGLGIALLYHAFGECYRNGIRTCELTVDAANPSGATRLYERAGMHPNNRTEVRYRKELRPVMG